MSQGPVPPPCNSGITPNTITMILIITIAGRGVMNAPETQMYGNPLLHSGHLINLLVVGREEGNM